MNLKSAIKRVEFHNNEEEKVSNIFDNEKSEMSSSQDDLKVHSHKKIENGKSDPEPHEKRKVCRDKRKDNLTKEDKIVKSVSEGKRKNNDGGATLQVKAPPESARRGSSARPQIKIPYLAQIERRISMDLLDYSGKLEGLKVWVLFSPFSKLAFLSVINLIVNCLLLSKVITNFSYLCISQSLFVVE